MKKYKKEFIDFLLENRCATDLGCESCKFFENCPCPDGKEIFKDFVEKMVEEREK